MAMDIFSGANLKVELGSQVSSGIEATDFVEVPSVASFTTSGFESTVIDVVVFNNSYNRKLLGSKKIPDISLEVNYIPDDVTHMKLETLADSQSRCQIRLSYYEDATHTTGFYVTYTVFVSTTTISGDKDEVVKKAFTLAVDGAAVKSGLLPLVP